MLSNIVAFSNHETLRLKRGNGHMSQNSNSKSATQRMHANIKSNKMKRECE
jgi:hypothetical protein